MVDLLQEISSDGDVSTVDVLCFNEVVDSPFISYIRFKISSRYPRGFWTYLDHSHHSRPTFLDLTCRTIHASLLEVLRIFTQSCYHIYLGTWVCRQYMYLYIYMSMLSIYACLCLIRPHPSCMFLPQLVKYTYYVPPYFD